jgi:hypothetical protein
VFPEREDNMLRLEYILSGLIVLGAAVGLAWGQSTPLSKLGYATSEQQFTSVQESLGATVPLNAKALLAYCVCEADRGKIIYAYGLARRNPDDVIADCILAARSCGGCFKPPATMVVGPSPQRIQAELDRQRAAMTGGVEAEGAPEFEDDAALLGTRTLGKSRFRRGRDD